jgi:phage/conjugal plasmid C-4 type zinc finger TraR family protein
VLDEKHTVRNRKWLLDEQARLTSELGGITIMVVDERPGYGSHMADHATEVFEQARNLAVSQRLKRTLVEVNRALEKMDQGTYHLCDRCGKEIDQARLQALPHATLCMSCQARAELNSRPRQ